MVKSYKEMISDQVNYCREKMNEGSLEDFMRGVATLHMFLKPKIEEDETYKNLVKRIRDIESVPTRSKATIRNLQINYSKLFEILIMTAIKKELLIIDPKKDILQKWGED